MRLVYTLLITVAFFAAGIVSRYLLRRTESRIQIAALCVLAVAVALASRHGEWGDAAIAAAAAAVGVLIVKFSLEGWNL